MKKLLLPFMLIPTMVWGQCSLNPHTVVSSTNSVVCQGQATIGLQSSDPFAQYFLVANGTDTVQSWVQGDMMGGPITFDPTNVYSTTNFSVKANQQFPSKSLNFNGVDQGVAEPGFLCGNSFTIIAWVNVQTANPVYTPFVEIGTFGGEEIWLGLQGANLVIWMDGALRIMDANALPLNQWIPVAVTYDSNTGNLTLMANGNPVGNINYSAIFTTAQGLNIGYDQWNYYLNGSMDHIAVFNMAMQPSQINNYVYNCLNPSTSGLIALYDFEEGMGNQTLNAATGMMADVLNVDMNSWFNGLWVCGPTCDLDMTNTVTVTVTNLPAEPFTAATNFFCDPGSSTTISSSSSFAGADYYLIDDATSNVVDGPFVGGGNITFNTPVLSSTTNFSVFGEWVAPSTGLEVFGEAIQPGDDMNFTDATAEGWFKHNTSHTYSSDPGILAIYNYDNVNDLPIEAMAIQADATTGQAYLANVNFPFPLPPAVVPSLPGTTNIFDGNWHHLAVVRDVTAGTFTLYVDGNPETSMPSTANTWNGGLVMSFDLTTFNGSVFGTYDDFRFWSAARSQAEINANKDDCLTGLETNLEGYWKMDDGTGVNVLNSAINGNLADLELDNNAVAGVDYAWTSGNTECTICENTVATVTVTVGDTEAPVLVCQDFSGQLDANGELMLTPSNLVTSVNDNCDASPVVTLSTSVIDCSALVAPASRLIITGVVDGPLGGGTPKAIELYVQDDIADLSEYGIGSANNGGGTDGQEFTFPAVSVMSNTYIYIASESPNFTSYFGFAPTYINGVANNNGDDAIELFHNGNVVDVFGDISYPSATGLPWLYSDGWAYRVNNSGPDGSIFNVNNWTYSGTDAIDGCTNNTSCASSMPIGSYNFQLMAKVPVTVTATDADGNSSSCVSEVTVTDQIAPVITGMPSNITIATNNAGCTAIATWAEPTITDNCGVHATMVTHPSGSAFPIGTTTVEYHAVDLSGNATIATFNVTIVNDLAVTANPTDALCFNEASGSLSLSVTGGTTPYTYNWSNGATTQDLSNIGEGTYSVLVTDANGCTASTTADVNEPSQITISASTLNPSVCGATDGEIDITVTGGTVTGAYSYLWNTGSTSEDLVGLTGGYYEITVTDDNGCEAVASGPLEDPGSPTLSINYLNSVLDVNCFGDASGSIELDIILNGGATSATFDWSNGASTQNISGLTAGFYSVVVTDDNGCTTGISETVTEPGPVTGTISSLSATCNGDADGELSVSPVGGDGNYTYLWDDAAASTTQDITGLAAGNYSVIITDGNGCAATVSGTVNEPDAVSGSITANNITCNGDGNGQLNLSPTGGVGSYSFLWNDAFVSTTEDLSGLSAGTYAVIITDGNGCSGTASATIIEPDAISGTITAADANCNGSTDGELALTPAGGVGNYTFIWNDASMSSTQNLTAGAGAYSVIITDGNGCQGNAAGTINEPAVLTASATSTDIIMGNDGTVTLTVNGGTSPYTYAWSGPASYTNNTQNLNGLNTAGTYNVTVTDANGCTATTSVNVSSQVGVSSVEGIALNIFPNPSSGMFTVNSSLSNGLIIVRDALGREIHHQQINSTTSFVNLENQSNGIYFMELRSGDVSKTVRVVVAK
jgi:hypothetical protein